MGKAKWKPLKLIPSNPSQDRKSKQYFIPVGMVEISVTIKDLDDAVVVVSIICQIICPVWPLQRPDGSRKMAINYYRSNQVVTPTEAAVARYGVAAKIVLLRP